MTTARLREWVKPRNSSSRAAAETNRKVINRERADRDRDRSSSRVTLTQTSEADSAEHDLELAPTERF